MYNVNSKTGTIEEMSEPPFGFSSKVDGQKQVQTSQDLNPKLPLKVRRSRKSFQNQVYLNDGTNEELRSQSVKSSEIVAQKAMEFAEQQKLIQRNLAEIKRLEDQINIAREASTDKINVINHEINERSKHRSNERHEATHEHVVRKHKKKAKRSVGRNSSDKSRKSEVVVTDE